MMLYKIREWSKIYENAQSRKCEQLHWLPLPARHDAERYCEMMQREDASEIFAAWIICLQVGARSHPRGSLVRSDGSPHTPTTLAVKTRGHQKWFEKALPYLTQIGWLEQVTQENDSATSQLPVECESPGQERRKEGMEGKKEKEAEPKASAVPKEFETVVIPEGLLTDAFCDIWKKWMVYRKKKKQSGDWYLLFRDHIKALQPFGERGAISALETALSKGWLDPYPAGFNKAAAPLKKIRPSYSDVGGI